VTVGTRSAGLADGIAWTSVALRTRYRFAAAGGSAALVSRTRGRRACRRAGSRHQSTAARNLCRR
jgi:hypothetical protein